MKRIISYLVLVSYSLIILKPVIPVVSDSVAHLFWKLEHISTVHSHDGDDHVHREIIETEEKNQSDETTPGLRYEVSVSPHLIAKLSYDFSIIPEIQVYNTATLFYHPQGFIKSDDPPPQG